MSSETQALGAKFSSRIKKEWNPDALRLQNTEATEREIAHKETLEAEGHSLGLRDDSCWVGRAN